MTTLDETGTDRAEAVLLEAAPESAPERTPQATGRHLEGLDGLRALAIAAVVLYHLDPAWLPGGFLGVDVFFVVSGFLITTLLQREAVEHGRIQLQRFWVRRVRRLVPALVVCVLTSTLVARLAHHDLVVGIGRQLVGALTFSTNWVETIAGSSYFDRTSPLLFMNFWSLAVEEQFYLVWPLAVGVIIAASVAVPSRMRRSLGLTVALMAAAASAGLMAALYTPGEDPTRVYYGTDTHSMGLMLGAALAFAWASPTRARVEGLWLRVRRPALVAAGALLGGLMLVLREDSPFTYRGGILLASVATAVLVAGLLPVAEEPSRWRTAMSTAPITWIGRRSYGIYLWHWPVIIIIDQQMRAVEGSLQYVVTRIWCVLVTIVIADLSYRFVEAPIRVWGFRACARMAWEHLQSPVSTWARVAAGAGVAALVLTAGVVATAPALSDTATVLAQNADDSPNRPNPAVTTGTASPGQAGGPLPSAPAPQTTNAGASPPQDWSMPSGSEIDVFGDSLVVVTKVAIDYYFPGVRQDAKSNRQWTDGLSEVNGRGSDIRRTVVLAFGTNAGVSEKTLTSVLDKVGTNRMVILVNLYGKASWIDEANRRLAGAAATRSNVIVADWNTAIKAHLDLLQSDGIHPGITGAHLYAKTIRQAMADLSTRHTGQAVPLKDLPVY
ncbi:acyltransferase family protein [Lapillicoccus sp.]|uniref:acyltransferase family protein n=1 Tax=Lapillicoccus sp. TaxID=1909287 RepID=UPI003267AEE0